MSHARLERTYELMWHKTPTKLDHVMSNIFSLEMCAVHAQTKLNSISLRQLEDWACRERHMRCNIMAQVVELDSEFRAFGRESSAHYKKENVNVQLHAAACSAADVLGNSFQAADNHA